jgi:hypothetical protein
MNLTYYKEVNFDFIPHLVEHIKHYILNVKKIDIKTVTDTLSILHNPRGKLLELINDELTSKGYPTIYYCLSYIRGPGDVQNVHVDGHEYIIKAALNIPVSGTEQSFHTWLAADFTLEKDMIYYTPQWKQNVVAIENLELLRPAFVRVDQPHFAQSNKTDPRWIITIRFNGNPSIEELIEISNRVS